ncbi:MAG: SigE family RNA polymerase sigma factor [Nocardioidaceae bacterium]
MAGAAEEAAFVEFATARAPGLFRSALLLTGEWHAAEDLVQETLGQVFARWTRVTRADNPAAYARAMQVNRFLSDQRRRSAGERPVAQPGDDGHPTSDPDAALRATLLRALGELDPRDRAVVVLRYWDDLDVATTAGLVGGSPTAVRARAHRALGRLRELLGDDLDSLLPD